MRKKKFPSQKCKLNDIVVVRPGEKIPVDGEVISGHAAVDQSSVTGESVPAEAGIGSRVYAATILKQGMLKVHTQAVGAQIHVSGASSKWWRMPKRIAPRSSDLPIRSAHIICPWSWALPRSRFCSAAIHLSTAAVLLVACSCTIALATPIAMLATMGANAKRGVLIKGGKYLETLARADVLLIERPGL